MRGRVLSSHGAARFRAAPHSFRTKEQKTHMTTEANDQPEPVIWFEGTLIRDPQPHGGQDDWLLETLADADGPKITIHASGEDHSANIRDNAHRGSRLMVKGTAGDEGSGIDIEATSLAFDPSHDEPDGEQ